MFGKNKPQGGQMKKKSLFHFLPIVAWLALFPSLPANAAEPAEDPAHILAYGVEKRKFEELVPGTKDRLRWVEKCVFFPIVDNRIKDSIYRWYSEWNFEVAAARATVQALQAMKEYYVVRENKLTPIRFGSFRVFSSEISHFATSDVPGDGCGEFLIFSKKQLLAASEPPYVEQHKATLKKNGKQLFIAAFQQLPAWVSAEERAAIGRHDLALTYDKSRKSRVGKFFDGKRWHLVRAYSATGSPTVLNALVLFKTELANESLRPSLLFVSTGDGERWFYKEYAGALDVDGDGINEIITKDGSYSYFSSPDRR